MFEGAYRPFFYMRVSITIPILNRFHLLDKVVKSIKDLTAFTDYEIICVDDGSDSATKDGLVKLASENFIDRLIFHPKNIGVATAVNNGWSISKGDCRIKYDSDILVKDKNWLSLLVECGDEFIEAGVFGIRVLRPYRLKPSERNGKIVYMNPPSINGGCEFVTERAFKRIGYMKQFSTPYGHEDGEYAIRSVRAGFRIAYINKGPDDYLKHLGEGEEDTGSYREWKNKCYSINTNDRRNSKSSELYVPFTFCGEVIK